MRVLSGAATDRFGRVLAQEDSLAALSIHDEIVGNVAIDGPPASKPLERARIVYESSSLWFTPSAHFAALHQAARAVGDDGAYLLARSVASELEDVEPPEGVVWVNLAELAETLRRCENRDEQPKAEHFEQFPREVVALLFNFYVREWSFFSPSGSWIWTAWDNADFAAMAGSNAFMDRFEASRVEVVNDAPIWISAEGHIFSNRIERPRPRRPRVPRFVYKLLSETVHVGDELPGSTLGDFLTRLYGDEVAAELWWIYGEMELMNINPAYGDAWNEFARLSEKYEWLPQRMRDIWRGEGTPNPIFLDHLKSSQDERYRIPPGPRVKRL